MLKEYYNKILSFSKDTIFKMDNIAKNRTDKNTVLLGLNCHTKGSRAFFNAASNINGSSFNFSADRKTLDVTGKCLDNAIQSMRQILNFGSQKFLRAAKIGQNLRREPN